LIPPPLEEIEQLTRRIVESEGMELVDLEFKSGKSRNLLRIFIDKTSGVTLDDCENVSRQLAALLDVKDLIKNAYVLEVSSPGIDRPFKTDRDYVRALGKPVRLHIVTGQGGTEVVLGNLREVSDGEVVIEQNGQTRRISRNEIRRGNQEIVLPGHPKTNRRKRK